MRGRRRFADFKISFRLRGKVLPMIDIKDVADAEEPVQEISLRGRALLDNSLLNKGSAFTEAERREFGLIGLLPPRVSTLEEQAERRYREYRQKTTDLERFLFLRGLQDRNETLFYRLLNDHLAEILPMIYTPEVGEVCQRYSHIYHRPRGLFISLPQQNDLDTILGNRPCRDVDVIVVTDGERILGLGDQGVGGMGIPVGKLTLYTLCGGIDPARTLPVVLDVGTDNPELLADPHYLGWRHARVRGSAYDAFVDAFVHAVQRHLNGVLLQWEDFGLANARRLLDRYRDQLCTFNDDVQGTGAVTLAALLAALRVTGARLRDQRIVFLGAGSAATGISDLLVTALARDGLSETEARRRLWLLDVRGLLLADMPNLLPWQEKYCRPPEHAAGWRRDAAGQVPFAEVVDQIRPTALIGVSGQPVAFTEPIVRAMARHVDRPIIFPLSNPTSQSEATPADLAAWTEGRALVATGSPFPPVTYRGRTIPIAQCNNAYVFPGVGLGVIAARARRVTDEMFLAAARALSECVPETGGPQVLLLPPLEDIRAVSRRIALAVGAEAQRQGLAEQRTTAEWQKTLDARRWKPRYRPMRHRA